MSSPREGWLSVGLIAVMMLALAWSVQEARWLESLQFVIPAALFSVVAATVLALTPLRPSYALPLGALAGGGVIIWAVGGEYFTDLDHLGRVLALREELVEWLRAVAFAGYPLQLTPYALGVGALVWVTGFMTAYAVLRHHRPLDGVLVAGTALVANMAATYTDLFRFLVLFAAAALLLLLRASLAHRELGWRARRVSETEEVPASIMRSGLIFAAGSLVLAWGLTSVAVGAPLGDAWRHLDTAWNDLSGGLNRIFGSVQNTSSRIGTVGYTSEISVSPTWESRDDLILTVASDRSYYLRAAAYDVYTGMGWRTSSESVRGVPPDQPLYPGDSLERPVVTGAFRRVTITVELEDPNGRALYTPGFPVRAYLPAVVTDIGGQPLFGRLEAASPVNAGEAYQISADVSMATEAQLASAGTEYPPTISALYLGTDGISAETGELALQVVEESGAADPYHQAEALANYLRTSPLFTYDTSVTLPGAGEGDVVHHFLFDAEGRRGFCQQFASSMVLMARSLGIPARLAVGYAPGDSAGDPGIYVVRQRDAHAWAELYFPGYGWQIFEATKSISPPFRLPGDPATGAPGAPAPLRVNEDPLELENLGTVYTLPTYRPAAGSRPVDGQEAAESATDRARGGNALVIGFLAVVALGVLLYIQRRSERRFARLPAAEQAWVRLDRTAGRAGAQPRPSETVYEYAGWLGRQIPSRRPEIGVIADGKVWAEYSGRPLPVGRQSAVRRAWQRLRVPMWLLVVRRRLAAFVGRGDGRT